MTMIYSFTILLCIPRINRDILKKVCSQEPFEVLLTVINIQVWLLRSLISISIMIWDVLLENIYIMTLRNYCYSIQDLHKGNKNPDLNKHDESALSHCNSSGLIVFTQMGQRFKFFFKFIDHLLLTNKTVSTRTA